MARQSIEYFYSTHSAFAYIGAKRLMELCKRHDCALIHRPIELSPVVERAGGLSFAGRTQAHVDYFFGREIERWAAFRGVPIINHRPTWHDNALNLSSGMVIAAGQLGMDVDALSHALLAAHWCNDIDLADAAALSQAAGDAGLDPAPLLQEAMSDEVQNQLNANTQEAIERGFFGSPTYVLDGDVFYGQDHLELLAHALVEPFAPTSFRNPPVGGGQVPTRS